MNLVKLKTKLQFQDETRKKAASTYLVENPDIPPPRYQKDGTLPNHHYPSNTANSGKIIYKLFVVPSLIQKKKETFRKSVSCQ